MCTDAEIETVEEICQKFRDAGFPDLADHIAEAWKRERSDAMKTAMMAKCEVCSEQPIGNAAAMREALVGLEKSVQDFMATKGRNFYPDLAVALEAAAAAISAPPRNCDVGTAEEQAERMRRQFCAKQKRDGIIDCSLCPIRHVYQRDCTLAWAQIPYEAEEGGAAQ